ncbi:unnamed protein product [Brugia pahangi]|uniref:SCP domain-containing protein n=1 Tax=Brugia pahangi TaxID=6280 RepID=A0A0N4TR72_BRUPA|nr:unnamed protein product [Brugia pahangi]
MAREDGVEYVGWINIHFYIIHVLTKRPRILGVVRLGSCLGCWIDCARVSIVCVYSTGVSTVCANYCAQVDCNTDAEPFRLIHCI